MSRWLTMQELLLELRIDYRTAIDLLKQGQLVGYKDGDSKGGRWRILDPGEKFKDYLAAIENRSEYFPFIGVEEAREILGLSRTAIDNLVHRKKITFQKDGKYTMFSPRDLRNYIRKRQKRKRTPVYISTIVRWFIETMPDLSAVDPHTPDLDQLNNEIETELALIMDRPEPQRSFEMVQFFKKMDTVNQLITVVKKSLAHDHEQQDKTAPTAASAPEVP